MNKKKKEKKEMSDKTRIILFSIVIIVVISVIGLASYFLLRDNTSTNNPDDIKKNVNIIDGYEITVDDLDSEYYKSEYEILKSNLTGGKIDYDKYAESIAKMFIIDLYTIDTKINKYDIGGIDFVLADYRANFSDNVSDTLYKYVEDNSNGKRSQVLPVVKEVKINSSEKSNFEIKNTGEKFDSYIIKGTISYEENNGYDTKFEVIIVNKDNKLYVVEKN